MPIQGMIMVIFIIRRPVLFKMEILLKVKQTRPRAFMMEAGGWSGKSKSGALSNTNTITTIIL